MNLFKNFPAHENCLDLMTNHAATLDTIEACKRLITTLEAYSWRSEVEEGHLKLAKANLYQLTGHKEQIYAHLRKFLN